MSYAIKQDFKYVGHDYWTWRAWIDASDDALDLIAKVVWVLHPTFPTPRIESDDRKSKFMLATAGWGTFTLFADLLMKDGHTQHLRHELVLEYSDESEGAHNRGSTLPAPTKSPTVFLSYGSEDTEHAKRLKNTLEGLSIKVTDANSIGPGEMIAPTVRRLIDKSDAVIGIIGSDTASPFLVVELEQARRFGKPIFTVTPDIKFAFGLPKELLSSAMNIDQNDLAASLQPMLGPLGKVHE